MRKRNLLKLPVLRATKEMMKLAAEDNPETATSWGGTPYLKFERSCYLRCMVRHGVLITAFYDPVNLLNNDDSPFMALFINCKEKRYLTYDYRNQKWTGAMLKNIRLPQRYYGNIWCAHRDETRIRRYLHREYMYGDVRDILQSYQNEVREAALDAKYMRVSKAWREENKTVPKLPKNWVNWVDKVGIPEQYIYYHYKNGGAKSGYCSFCEAEVPIEKPKHNAFGQCSQCGHKIQFKAIGRVGFLMTPRHTVHLPQKTPDGMVIREFQVWRRQFKGEHTHPTVAFTEVRRSFYTPEGRPLSAYYYGTYKQRMLMWIKTPTRSPNYSYWYNTKGMVYGRTLPLLDRKGLSRSGLPAEAAKGEPFDPEAFLAKYNDGIIREQLQKANLPALLNDYRCQGYSGIILDLRPMPLKKALGIDTFRLKRLRENGGGALYLKWLRHEKAMDSVIPDHVINWMCEERIRPEECRFIGKRMSFLQIYNYMTRQMQESGMSSNTMLITWKDYLNMAAKLNYDVSDEIVYRTSKLRQRHDELVERSRKLKMEERAKPIEQKFPKIRDICESIKDKFTYEGEDYVVTVPNGVADILAEGDSLHHCLAGSDRYYERIERHESYLLFLRRAAEPNEPYYTMEVEPNGTMRQIRTMYDRQGEDIAVVREFLRGWQRVVEARLTKDDRVKANKSKSLRKEEFRQMRRDQVRIHNGDLAGRLLVEVLTADLMEAA